MKLLGLDFETNSTDVQTTKVTEVGLVLWDTDYRQPVEILDYLISDHCDEIPEEATELNGITVPMLKQYGKPWVQIIPDVLHFYKTHAFEGYVAHNGLRFDVPILKSLFGCIGEKMPDVPVIDTMIHVPYPRHIKKRDMVGLAALHGFVNPFPHRAATDVLTMFKVLNMYSLDLIMERVRSLLIRLKTNDVPYDLKDEVRELGGFFWNDANRCHVKELLELELPEFAEKVDALATLTRENFKVVSPNEWDEMEARSRTKKIWVEALVSKQDRFLAKDRGYWWKEKQGRMMWVKELREYDLDRERKEAPFSVVEV